MASPVAGIFVWIHLKQHIYADPYRTMEDVVARLQAAVTTGSAFMFRRELENAARRSRPSNGRRPYRTPK